MIKRQKTKMLAKLDDEPSTGGTARAAKRARSAAPELAAPPVPVAAILPMAYAVPLVHVPCFMVPEGECDGVAARNVSAQPLES